MGKLTPYVLLIPLYAMLALFAWGFALQFSSPVEIRELKYKSVPVFAGDIVKLTWDITWNRTCTYNVDRYLKNGGTTHLENYSITWQPRVEHNFNVEINLPRTLHDGNYEIITNTTAVCNIFDYLFPIKINVPNIPIEIDNNPVKNHSIELLTPLVKVGQPLRFTFHVDRRRECYSTLSRYLFDADAVLIYTNSRQPIVDTGPRIQTEQMDLPKLSPGHYVLKTVSNFQCAEGMHIVKYNDMEFTVVR